ncbi:hypothetical protein ACTFIU_011155 [Dictyostelium citrinum]
MEFLNLPTTDSSMDQVLLILDSLSKMVKNNSLQEKHYISRSSRVFWKKIVCNYGFPLSIFSDKDKLFKSELWTNLMNEASVKLKTTALSTTLQSITLQP